VILNPLSGSPPSSLADRRVGKQEPQAIGQISGISALKGKARAIDYFPIFRNVARPCGTRSLRSQQRRSRQAEWLAGALPGFIQCLNYSFDN
jgi:hypothetical protein